MSTERVHLQPSCSSAVRCERLGLFSMSIAYVISVLNVNLKTIDPEQL